MNKEDDPAADPAALHHEPPDLTPAEKDRGMHYVLWAASLGIVFFFAADGNVFTLFVKRLGASNTQIGALISLLQIFTVVQVFIAGMIERRGKKPFIIGGWLVATTVTFSYVAIPWVAEKYGAATAISWLMIAVIPVSLARQVAAPGWMPLINDVVPAEVRGRFFGKMRIAWQAVSVAFLLFITVFFAGQGGGAFWRYQVLFLIGIAASFARVYTTAKIPELPPTPRKDALPVWKALVSPFSGSVYMRYTVFSTLLTVALATSDTYTVVYLKNAPMSYNDSYAIFLSTGVFYIGSALSLWSWGILVDKVGSRPLLIITTAAMGLVRFMWLGVLWAPGIPYVIPAYYFLNGVFTAGYGIANTTYLFAISPRHYGKTTYIVTAGVVAALVSSAMVPVGGYTIDGLSAFHHVLAQYGLDEYRLPFIASGIMALLSVAVLFKVEERGAAPTMDVVMALVTRPLQALYNVLLLIRPFGPNGNGGHGDGRGTE